MRKSKTYVNVNTKISMLLMQNMQANTVKLMELVVQQIKKKVRSVLTAVYFSIVTIHSLVVCCFFC